MSKIEKLTLGTAPAHSLLAHARAESRVSPADSCDLSRGIQCQQVGDRFVIRVPFNPSERLYGLGLAYEKLTLNMQVRHLRVDHYSGKGDTGRTHAPVPFYVSDAGYGVFVDVALPISFYMGGAVRKDAKNPPPIMSRGHDDDWRCDQPAEFVEISFSGTGAQVYVIEGGNMLDVVSSFNLLCGGGCLPPKWGLGFWHRVFLKYDEQDVKRELREFAEHDLHVDVLGLEPGWQTNAYPCTFEWDRDRFPDPARFVNDLLDDGTRLNLWENMYVAPQSGLYEEISPYCGSHMVWGGAVPDMTIPEARALLADFHARNHVELGVGGYKVDECDGIDAWLWPDHAEFPSGTDALEIRQMFGVALQKMFDEMYRASGRRTYGLVRASNAGAAPLPFCIYNDCYSFKQFLTGLAAAGFSGVLWVPEVRDAKTAEEWVRRFQLCALSPMLMLNAWANGAKPWAFPEVYEHVLAAIELRRKLLPYFYNAFAQYREQGRPPFRALVMDYNLRGGVSTGKLDHEANPYQAMAFSDVVDQYLFGDSMMVAPMLPGEAGRRVLLPPGQWHDFYTGELAGEQTVIQIECPLDRIPIYVKAGAMIPMLERDGSLTVRCYGEAGESSLYDDDGESFDYEQGKCARIDMSFRRISGAVTGRFEIVDMGYETKYREISFV